MDHIFLMGRSNNFAAVRQRFGVMFTREISSYLRFKDNNRVPLLVPTIYLRISLVVLMPPYPDIAFLRLLESLIYPGMEVKISLRERSIISKILCCWAESPCVEQSIFSM